MRVEGNKAIEEPQRKLLREIMSLDILSTYCLVGGTNLALRYEHRISVDLDIFRYNPIANIEENRILSNEIKRLFPTTEILNVSRLGAFLYINNIKVDIIEYPIPFFNIETLEGIRLASKLDIAAMKINAITNRGTRKDFYDLYELLKEFSLKEIIDSYKQKYKIDNVEMALRSLIYFSDAEDNKERNNKIISLCNEDWEEVKDVIEEKYNQVSFNLSSLADEMDLSSGYLSSLFKNLFGIPFQDYLNNIRMEKAKLLLLTTDLKNYEIAELVGIENFNYFNSKFKKTFGITPKEFKKSVLEKL